VAELAVIGGSGFYEFLAGGEEIRMETPYGTPSSPITLAELSGREVAFIARHGRRHELPPHRINSRANLWALAKLGVRRVIGPCACGSLSPNIAPGDVVVVDQLVDRTWGRADTFFDGPKVHHAGFADPYCPELRSALLVAAHDAWPAGLVHQSGTVVVIQGPRFSTRAESRFYASAGCKVINMTQYPEAYLARELGMCYAGIALVTDRDVGIEGDPGAPPVTMEAAMAVLADNVEHTRQLLAAAIPAVPPTRSCACGSYLPEHALEELGLSSNDANVDQTPLSGSQKRAPR
jgi:5'-methylthioadenosine phosphorylase